MIQQLLDYTDPTKSSLHRGAKTSAVTGDFGGVLLEVLLEVRGELERRQM